LTEKQLTLKNPKIRKLRKIIFRIILFFLLIIIIGYLLPQRMIIPVEGATSADWHPESFWYYPWGKSVTHKGIDIFASKGTNVISSTSALVVYTGKLKYGGNVVLALGPKWRFHYYAHLNTIDTKRFSFVKRGSKIGTVGDSGNAVGKPPHLHYTLVTQFPYFWLADKDRQGWKKMFYLDPTKYFEN
jgi:hypothetical protein